MNSFQRSRLLGLTSLPAATQVAYMKTITPEKIALADLLATLNFRKMLTKTSGNGGAERWKGSVTVMESALIAAAVVPDDPTDIQLAACEAAAAAVAEYDVWFSHITNPRNSYWDTTQPAYAVPFAAMRAQFENSGIFAEGDFDAIYALGGGLEFPDLTTTILAADEVTTLADEEATAAAEAADQVKQELREYLTALEATFHRLKNLALLGIENGTLVTHEELVAAVLVEGA